METLTSTLVIPSAAALLWISARTLDNLRLSLMLNPMIILSMYPGLTLFLKRREDAFRLRFEAHHKEQGTFLILVNSEKSPVFSWNQTWFGNWIPWLLVFWLWHAKKKGSTVAWIQQPLVRQNEPDLPVEMDRCHYSVLGLLKFIQLKISILKGKKFHQLFVWCLIWQKRKGRSVALLCEAEFPAAELLFCRNISEMSKRTYTYWHWCFHTTADLWIPFPGRWVRHLGIHTSTNWRQGLFSLLKKNTIMIMPFSNSFPDRERERERERERKSNRDHTDTVLHTQLRIWVMIWKNDIEMSFLSLVLQPLFQGSRNKLQKERNGAKWEKWRSWEKGHSTKSCREIHLALYFCGILGKEFKGNLCKCGDTLGEWHWLLKAGLAPIKSS